MMFYWKPASMYVGVCNNVYISRQCDTSRCNPSFEKVLEEVTHYIPRYMEEMDVKAVYNDLHNTLMAINEQDKLHWLKNIHRAGMPTDWPQFQLWLMKKCDTNQAPEGLEYHDEDDQIQMNSTKLDARSRRI
ncbi:unnamed protein product [Coregonus sp. 'balchen']|nr:unnamed protein product [Coregonus sp. 'balchen']